MNLFFTPRGRITSRYGNNDAYRPWTHEGIDFGYGFRRPCYAMRGGLVYKIYNKDNPDLQKYRTVFTLVETPIGPMEVAYTHCWDIYVNEGDRVLGGQKLYSEGNTGELVYSGGVQVTAAEKWSGRGSHSHISVRPVQRVKDTIIKGHYLRTTTGSRYKDSDGNFYLISNPDNGTKGWVDFEQWMYVPPQNLIDYFFSVITARVH